MPWESRFAEQYAALVERLGREHFRQVVIDDPDAPWALGRAGAARSARSGHEMLGD